MVWLGLTLWTVLLTTITGYALSARAARAYVPAKVRNLREERRAQYLYRRMR